MFIVKKLRDPFLLDQKITKNTCLTPPPMTSHINRASPPVSDLWVRGHRWCCRGQL